MCAASTTRRLGKPDQQLLERVLTEVVEDFLDPKLEVRKIMADINKGIRDIMLSRTASDHPQLMSVAVMSLLFFRMRYPASPREQDKNGIKDTMPDISAVVTQHSRMQRELVGMFDEKGTQQAFTRIEGQTVMRSGLLHLESILDKYKEKIHTIYSEKVTAFAQTRSTMQTSEVMASLVAKGKGSKGGDKGGKGDWAKGGPKGAPWGRHHEQNPGGALIPAGSLDEAARTHGGRGGKGAKGGGKDQPAAQTAPDG